MRKTLPLIILTAILAVPALAQSGSSVFTNGPTGPCSVTQGGSTYYCTAAQTFDANGVFSGYIGFFFTLKADGTFAGGHVYLYDACGNVILTADNFAGTKNGTVIAGVFSTPGFSGSASEAMGTERAHCYRGSCRTVPYMSTGSGAYVKN
jgi:hypothetical protein